MPTTSHPLPDRYTLYQLCAQNPARDAALLRAIHADLSGAQKSNLILGEDFSGHAALSLAWCQHDPASRAVAVDHDPEALARADTHPRIKLVCADVLKPKDKADTIGVLNFSICELRTRAALVRYFKHARSRLRPKGCLICDIYGGVDSHTTGTLRDRAKLPDGRRVTYEWEQRTADPMTARVTNAMHFTIHEKPARAKIAKKISSRRSTPIRGHDLRDAFVYHWRLWTLPELADAMTEAGFSRVAFYERTPAAMDDVGTLYPQQVQDAHELPEAYNVFVAAAR